MSQHSVLFYKKLDEFYSDTNKKKPWTTAELKEISADILLAKQTPGKKTRRQYHLLSLYNVQEIAGRQIVIKKKKTIDHDPVSIICYEDIFNVLFEIHISVGHGGRDKMLHALQKKHDIARYAVETLIETCEVCQKKKNKSHANLTIKPIISKNFNSRGQVDLMDFQSYPDNHFKWLFNYQDHLTKFLFLRPLKSKTANEVATELLKIFLEIGAPSILQSDNGREFTNSVISELIKMWPTLKLLHGRPRHPQSQGSIERSNQDVENMLRAWMHDHKTTNWSLGCYFVQFQKNTSYHKVIGRTPYNVLFGLDPKVGFSSVNLPKDLLDPIENEDHLVQLLEIPDEENNSLLSYNNITGRNCLGEDTEETREGEDGKTGEKVDEINERYTTEDGALESITKSNNINNSDVDRYKAANVIPNIVTPTLEITNKDNLELCITCSESDGNCVLCQNKASIKNNRNEANQGQKRAAEAMLITTANKLPSLEIGSCVLLPVDKIDRGSSDMQNLICVITDYRNGVYQVGCSAGRIKSWFNRPDLIHAKEQFLTVDNVPHNYFSKREAVQALSLVGGQGYFKCSCKPAKKQCLTNRCICYKKKVLCNSRCHKTATCANK